MSFPFIFPSGGPETLSSYMMTNALLFRGAQVAYRSFTSSSTIGLSVWVRRGKLGVISPILGSSVKFNSNDTLTVWTLTTTAVYRDPTAWLHIAVAAGHLYVNGVDMGAVTASAFTCTSSNGLGYDGSNYFDGYMAEPVLFNGSQPSITSLGKTDTTTLSWVPKSISGATDYLGKPWNGASLGTDYSGNSNTWTTSGFVSTDVVSDTPTNVYASLNTLSSGIGYSSGALSEGNLKPTWTGGGNAIKDCTIVVTSGLWWFTTRSPSNDTMIGVRNSTAQYGWNSGLYTFYNYNGLLYTDGSSGSGFSGGAANDDLVCALDMNNKRMWIGRKPSGGSLTWLGGGDPASGTTPTMTGLPASVVFTTMVYGSYVATNFGQLSWSIAPVGSFKALCTANMTSTTGATSGTFTGNANADGTYVFTGGVPATLTINGNAVTWGIHADKLATGFKLRTSSTSYNSTGTNTWTATYSNKPTVGSNYVPSNAQGNP